MFLFIDADPAQAEETRKNIMEHAVSKKMLIAGMHLGQAGFASILRAGNGYRMFWSEQ
jgi:hypothetical protein